MTTKTPRVITRVKYVPEEIEARAIESTQDAKTKRLAQHEKWYEDENIKTEELNKFCIENRTLSLNRYIALFQIRWGKLPLAPFILAKLCRTNNGSKQKIFDSITKFLKAEREENNADNNMYSLYTDYYNAVFNYYAQYNRKPTINQISAGPTNKEQFSVWSYHEQHSGGYWLTKKQIERSKTMADCGSGYKDIFIDKMRIENGLEPIWGTTAEDIANWDGK